ncbi:extracellular solute-binding protein [Mesorhizobium sp.]|uniref:extracellular solute-binding protein n=1 Tax=Mesorhizobium sp. TaxID=1871066 RepID=UPI000FE91F6C|nr:extracellular solute-binding protein [Mesorhizobium sp.]RWA69137.1 MAG: extracellular solute-binding protein [Mesorhizobium sp.]RWB17914.1 MAG: extracellular solute-binding protein [Mesorhizobium sp.]
MNVRMKLGVAAIAVGLMSGTALADSNDDFWAKAAEPYKGVVLHGVTESTPPSNYIKDVLAPEFEKKTGIKVEIETTSWDQMYDKAIKDMEAGTGIYDMVYIEQDIIYSYLARNFLVDITKELKDNPSLKAPTYDDANFTTFADYFKQKDDLYGVPMEAFIKIYLYRKDLFDDPEIKAAFKKQTGHDLAPATTHEQYTEIADFFTKWGKDHDMQLWGSTAQAHTGHPASWYEFFESVAPTFGVYNWGINASDNYGATVEHGGQMNSDKAKAALKWWLHLRDVAPPESVQSTWSEVATTFAAGRAAQGLVYGENAAWIQADESKSKVVGKVGFALPPLSPGVKEDAESRKGYIGYYDGGAFGIPVSSKNKEASALFLEYIGQDSVQPGWAIAAPRITNKATYDDPQVKDMDKKLGGYYTMLKDDGHLFAGAPPYPFHAQVREATAPIFYKILTGELGADEGLDQMAAKAEEELTTLGYRK